MARYAAFLRAVNLGSTRKVSGARLCEILEGLELEDVASFRTSGNAVFATTKKAKLRERIEAAFEQELGFEVPIYLRTEKELAAIEADSPFKPKEVERSDGKLQVAFLPGKPSAAAQKKVLALATDEDPLGFGKRELYWLPSGGLSDSDLDLEAIDKLVGPSTRRTMGTISAISAKFFA
jgi:uncharacterized protein (DUF1697 family)